MEYLNTGVSYEKLALTVNALYKIPLAYGRLTLRFSCGCAISIQAAGESNWLRSTLSRRQLQALVRLRLEGMRPYPSTFVAIP